MHIVPGLIRFGEALDLDRYKFCFAAAAFHWADLSIDPRKALADAAGFDLDKANVYARDEEFIVDLFGDSSWR